MVSISNLLESAANELDQSTDDSDEDEHEHEVAIAKPRKGSKGMLVTKTSQAMLADMINEEEERQNKVAEFLSQIKDGNVIQSKASKFRERRLTFASKEKRDDPPASSPPEAGKEKDYHLRKH